MALPLPLYTSISPYFTKFLIVSLLDVTTSVVVPCGDPREYYSTSRTRMGTLTPVVSGLTILAMKFYMLRDCNTLYSSLIVFQRFVDQL